MLKKFLKRVAVFFLVLILLAGVALYFSRGLIAETISKAIDEELSQQGIHLAYTPTNFSLFSGLGFTELTLYESEERARPVIELSNIAVGYKLMDLIFSPDKRSAVVQTDNAVLIAHHEGEPYRFEQINASVSLSQSEVTVERLTGNLFGLDIDLAGDVELATDSTPNPQSKATDSAPKPAPETTKAPSEPKDPVSPQTENDEGLDLDLSPIAEIAEAIKLEANGDAPQLKVRFKVDKEQNVQANAQLDGKDFSWDGIPIDSLSANVDFEDSAGAPVISLRSLQLGYGGQPLLAEGTFEVESETVVLTKLDSKVDLASLASQFSESAEPEMLRFLDHQVRRI
ncbi:MAG: hypothetical protein AAGH89_13720, partial [Verrucomicrobiota bacterium]